MILQEFIQPGFSTVRIYEDHFEIKAIDYWEFRAFLYEEVIEIDYYNPRDKWYYPIFHRFGRMFASAEPYQLKILKKNGGDWTYTCPSHYDSAFVKVIKDIILRCGMRPEHK